MAIKFIKGSLLDSQSQTLVCPVNCVGVMDEGLALSFKLAYPSMYERYKYYENFCICNHEERGTIFRPLD